MQQFLSYLPLVVAGLIALALFGLFFKHAESFDFSKLKGNHPNLDVVKLPAKFDNSIAGETGSVVSETLLAKAFAVVFAVAFVVLLVLIVGATAQGGSGLAWRLS